MTFVFDENVSPAIVTALRALDYPAIHCTEFVARGTADEVLFREIATHGHFLVTQDQNMSRKKHQRAAMLSLDLGVFIFTGKASRTNKEFALLVQQCFAEMIHRSETTNRPFVFGITDRRRFERQDTGQRRRGRG